MMTILLIELLNNNGSSASVRGGWGVLFIKKSRLENMCDFCKEKAVCVSWLEEEKLLSTIYSHSMWGKYNIR